MQILLIGAGELGQLLAEKLCSDDNDITIVDSDEDELKHIQDSLDVRTIQGDATDIEVMKCAGIKTTELLIAASGDQASNMIACRLGKHFGVEQRICRLYSNNAFSESDGITREFYGIDEAFSSQEECLSHIQYILEHQIVTEHVEFSNPNATMVTFFINEDSPLKNLHVKDIPAEHVHKINLAALVHFRKLSFPSGDTVLREGDMVYVAGQKDSVEEFLKYATGAEENQNKLIIIGGTNRMTDIVAKQLVDNGFEVRIVTESQLEGEALLDILPEGTRVIIGSTTDKDTLIEAGISNCDAYVNTELNDENTILSCILAKRLGAKKVIAVTHKAEYNNIVPTISMIDCGLNSTIISVNKVFKLIKRGSFHIDTRLRTYNAGLKEYEIGPKSPLVNHELKDCKLPKNVVLALVFRGENVMAPSGTTKFQEGDIVTAICNTETEKLLIPFFK